MSKKIIAVASATAIILSSCLSCTLLYTPVFTGKLADTQKQLSFETDNEKLDRINQLAKECKRQEEEKLRILEEQRIQREKELSEQKEIERKASVTYNPYNVTIPSNLTVEEMYQILRNTTMKELSEALILAEKETGINALFLTGLIANESSWNTSNRAKCQNNLSGFAVYSRGASGVTFNSKTQCILRTAYLIKEDYISPNGKYYCEGNSIWNINSQYCFYDGTKKVNYKWSSTINSIAYSLLSKYKG